MIMIKMSEHDILSDIGIDLRNQCQVQEIIKNKSMFYLFERMQNVF